MTATPLLLWCRGQRLVAKQGCHSRLCGQLSYAPCALASFLQAEEMQGS